ARPRRSIARFHTARPAGLRTGAPEPRLTLRWTVLHRGPDHAHLLPPDVPGAGAESDERRLLPAPGRCGSGGLSPLPALPAGTLACGRLV
ncbi:MAG: Methylphosphotriester-DNA--protein-cysteine S-methyltransferase (EC / DNA-3-methyladenine glycosylase II, partial [uncultured Lysobacter sp.]